MRRKRGPLKQASNVLARNGPSFSRKGLLGQAGRAAFALLLLTACGESSSESPRVDDLPPSAASPEAPSVDPTGAEAARAVIREYYDAISAHDGRRAYLLWADSGRATNQTLEAFVTGYARTTSVRASVGTPGRVEGAAGSRYVEIPVEIRAEADTLQCFTGSYALRRSVVEGATEAQRHWRIYDADLEPCRSDQRQGRARGP